MPSTSQQLLVQAKAIKAATLHQRLPLIQHAYVWPFPIVYLAWLYVYTLRYDDFLGSQEFTALSLILVFMVQALAFLTCQWSVNIRAMFTCRNASGPYEAELVKIIAADHLGKSALCDMVYGVDIHDESRPQLSFTFQAVKYIYDDDKKIFSSVSYPSESCPPLGELQRSTGLEGAAAVKEALEIYGENRFTIPVPTFIDLFKEHAVAPFFVFQVFCVGLWCMDEYWYYSIFTLVMLVVFESTLVFQRLRTLNEFRSLSMHPYKIQALRSGQWTEIGTELLCPGDVVSVVRTAEDSGVPCDVILLEGTCIVNEAMLSGESTPQLKESIHLRDATDHLDMEGADKNSMLFGGTKVLQVEPPHASSKVATPDGGCACYVLRTGFGTSQGELVRTMIHSTDRVSADNKESYLFIGFLLIFAILASSYVWIVGSQDARRPKSKVLLDCVLIITSVVPPELPMELSMAVNSSLMALSKLAIFCTEPFRIPNAGKVDICCFDKTGTLTGEDLIVEGVAGAPGSADPSELSGTHTLGRDSVLTLASAHALVQLESGELVGDPMERTQLDAVGFKLVSSDIIVPDTSSTAEGFDKMGVKVDKLKITVSRRFAFSSALKRSATLSVVSGLGASAGKAKHNYFVAAKGAPETLRGMLRSVPSWYDETYKAFSRRGGRVLTLGCKWMPRNAALTEQELNDLARDEIESDLEFQGFLVFSCPLKPDSAAAIKMLNESSHRCVMITGDSPLTATHVAREVGIVDRGVLVFEATNGSSAKNGAGPVVTCTSIDETVSFEVDVNDEARMRRAMDGWDLCLTGSALEVLQSTSLWKSYLLHHAWIYARVSPSQKEFVLTEYKLADYITLMCGDGTNDVGALKQAHVGVALLNGSMEDLQAIAERQTIERLKQAYDAQCKIARRFNQPPPNPPPMLKRYMESLAAKEKEREKEQEQERRRILAAGGSVSQSTIDEDKKRLEAANRSEQLAREAESQRLTGNPQTDVLHSKMTEWMMQMDTMEDDVPVLKFGDASVAAPFTSKLGSINAICNIIRQGRSALVATTQMYKILGLNCLISAYNLSVLYLEGIKYGDWQATIMGMLMSVCFLCISKSSPLEKLSKERPQTNILTVYMLLTVLGQFAVHVAALVYLTLEVRKYEPSGEVDLEKKFEPSLLNTAMYMISLSQQVSTFAINYQGHPFRESLKDNKILYRGLAGVGAIAAVCAMELMPEFNEYLKLVPMPGSFRDVVCVVMAADFALAFLVEKVCAMLFADYSAKPIARHDTVEATVKMPDYEARSTALQEVD
ncbi:putative cation-transporting ATPase 1 [Coemansia thaxteri]|uniref:Cation-transporting ATPase 1 n=1 Tax=Coemansia thaxteri TaxID=2663907 RepID=A0A9W8EHV6_9FUNG|nr:putative cation-transporting ATPase 1 [Coemansia thaxteri]KAJ2008695.1 putative cation-transporting ATPase 1 [Coemansia thaxteri]KAJ2473902.1 putative cation-transporting ATPase 1 [Coemansia sp. RSA 2322]KAJ2488077.1 putative cation-transporting ATPase 1 [Coemansia sp. RSA 2320]